MDEEKQGWWPSRMNRIGLGIGLLAVLGVAALALTLWLPGGEGADRAGSSVTLHEGQTAPDFSLPAVGGGKVSMSDFRGKPVLLYFSMGSG